ncbi:MAG: hypothetical protein ABIB97_05735 [Patescibacteria group bacterium]
MPQRFFGRVEVQQTLREAMRNDRGIAVTFSQDAGAFQARKLHGWIEGGGFTADQTTRDRIAHSAQHGFGSSQEERTFVVIPGRQSVPVPGFSHELCGHICGLDLVEPPSE